MKKATLTLLALIAAMPAAAQQLEYLDVAALKASSKNFEAPAPAARPVSVKGGNYYLDANSYDPLLLRRRPAADAAKINLIGGTIDIPGINNDLEFARQYRQAGYQRYDVQSDVALAV